MVAYRPAPQRADMEYSAYHPLINGTRGSLQATVCASSALTNQDVRALALRDCSSMSAEAEPKHSPGLEWGRLDGEVTSEICFNKKMLTWAVDLVVLT